YRFSEDVITRIVNLRIYKRPDDEIEKLIPLLSSDDISTLETALTELCPWEKDT
ncbi:TPA: antibiotic acetyltransferase, partial [Yersinia enterocolitica]|nr:antibiotic acetyltransferase [Yersinia enterocolitica]